MIKIENRETVYFDVDDTLILWNVLDCEKEKATKLYSCGTYELVLPHEKHITSIKEHKARGHIVVVWSQGGSDWAEQVVNELGLQNYVDLIISKPYWFYDDLPASLFMSENKRYWKDPTKSKKVIEPQNDNSDYTSD